MSISATYVSATQFTVSGNKEGFLRPSGRIEATMGVDGIVEGTISARSYDEGSSLTTVTIAESVLTSNLATIRYSKVYSDGSSSSSNLSEHDHTGPHDGGTIPAAGLSQAEIDLIGNIPVPAGGDDGKVLRVNDAEDGYELFSLAGAANQLIGVNAAGDEFEAKTLSGTSNEVTVTHGVGNITLGLDDDVPESKISFNNTSGHNHNGTDSKAIAHSDTTGQTTDDHHAQVHGSADHSGTIGTESQITFDNTTGHSHDTSDSTQVDHVTLANVGTTTHADIDSAITNSADHIAASAPHSGHESIANKGSACGYCGLDESALIDGDNIPAASTSKKGAVPLLENTGSKVLYDDGTWATPPGASGGEANTASNVGSGGVDVFYQKSGVDLEFNTLDSDDFDVASNVISLKSSGSSSGGAVARSIVEGRIDRASDTSLEWTPVNGNGIGLWNGSTWEVVTPSSNPTLVNTATDLDSASLAVDSLYDIFAEYSSSTAFTLVAKKWSDSTPGSSSRGYALYQHEGVYVHKNTANGLKRRYLGTVYMYNDSATPKFKDEQSLRLVANYYNRKSKPVYTYNGTSPYWTTLTDDAWREANGGTNQVRGYFVLCLDSESLRPEVHAQAYADATNSKVAVSIGVSTTTNSMNSYPRIDADAVGDDFYLSAVSPLSSDVNAGYNYLTMVEYGSSDGSFRIYYGATPTGPWSAGSATIEC